MRLPKDILSSQIYTKPNLYLCETDKTKICKLETTDTKASLKFNAYSELSFTVGRTYDDMISGQQKVNPFYDKIEALRLIYVEGFGYFEIQDPEIESDGIREVKNITAYSYEYTLSQKYIENFYINTGEAHDIGVNSDGTVTTIVLYDPLNPSVSLLHLALEKIYGWEIGHVDESLRTMSRKFEVSRISVYDFLVQDVCEKFNCFFVFDTINNTINVYAEYLINRQHVGDGETKSFQLNPIYRSIGEVKINGYRTIAYFYDNDKGILTFDTAPEDGAKIEVTDGYQEQWMTDVYVNFDNLATEVNVSYSADDIKTVLTVKGADDLSIREVNMGLPYIVDLSFYHSIDWMGEDLYYAYADYNKKVTNGLAEYKENSQKMWELSGQISYAENRLSLEYSIADHVTSTTVGTYYVQGGAAPNYYYTEVSLPSDYSADVEHYYTLSGNDLTETKFSELYEGLKTYFNSGDTKDVSKISAEENDFTFMKTNTISVLTTALSNATTLTEKDAAILLFFDEMWEQLGKKPLNTLYYAPYTAIKETNEKAGWNDTSNANYWFYYPVTLVLRSLETEMKQRDDTIAEHQAKYDEYSNKNAEIAKNASIYNNFTDKQLIRLSAFLREDEYTDDNFVQTDYDSTETVLDTKQELLECGRIELSKLCEPKLEFSMDMANIYALPEFEPIIHQFDLGNLINVAIRSDYIKRARLLEVNINFDDFSDFSCSFGELTSLKTQSSIHADLLASALTAGKSVASNASYWNKGSNTASSLSSLIQQGLLDATTTIKAIDGTQGVSIDKTGIHLRLINPETGEIDPKEGWIVNNQFLYSDDNFKTTKSVFGEYTFNDQTFWGLIAEACVAGYIAGCTIEGGIIKIGLQADGTYAFEVREDGSVIMNGNNTIDGYVTENDLSDIYHMKENIDQNFEFNKGSGLTIGQTDNAFYANITSQEMGFYDNSDTNSPNQKVVNIGNKSATIQNAVFQGSEGTQFENNVTFKQQINISKPNTTAGFAWKLEQNGSLSLAIIS